MSTSTRTFEPIFENLFDGGDGLIELRALPGKERAFVKPGDNDAIQRFIDQHSTENIFFGVAARKDSQNGRLENCSAVRAIFVDVDAKSFSSTAEARMRIEEFPLQPSIVINSGGGFHLYWVLHAAIDVQRDLSTFRDVLRRTARALNGDLAAAEAARVLRIPGTLNFKYDPPALVTVKSHRDVRYSIDDFEFLPPEPEPEKSRAHRNGNGASSHRSYDRQQIIARAEKYLDAIPPAIEGNGGDRHTYLTCCKLVRDFGLTEAETLDLLSVWNSSCQPPWTERELQQKIENALRYGDNPIGWKLQEDPPQSTRSSPVRSSEEGPQIATAAAAICEVTQSDEDEIIRPNKYSDDALADQFSSRHEHDLRYVPSWGWLEWAGQRWRRIADVLEIGRAHV